MSKVDRRNGRRKILPKLTPEDTRWKEPSKTRPGELCLLFVDKEPLDRQPVASAINTNAKHADLDAIVRNEWCPYRMLCLNDAALHDDGRKKPRIQEMGTWVCAESCPYFCQGHQEHADPWKQQELVEPSGLPGVFSLRPVPETAYAVLQTLAREHVRGK